MNLEKQSNTFLSLIRDGQPMTLKQQLRLTAQLSMPAIMAQVSSLQRMRIHRNQEFIIDIWFLLPTLRTSLRH